MKSAYSQTGEGTRPKDLEILASARFNEDLLRAEERFRKLPVDERVNLVMSYPPQVFQVETTTRCNLNCPLCSTHHLKRGRTETSLDMMTRIGEGNPRLRYMCLHLMGEPLLCGALFSIIRYLKTRHVYTYFSTNGMLLEKNTRNILSSGLDKISISLDGITQEDLGRYRVNADFATILTGIKRLKAERDARGLSHPLIQVQTIMFSYNEIKEEEVVRFLKSLGIDRIKLKKPSFDTFGGRNSREKTSESAPADAAGKYSRRDPAYVKYRERGVCRLLFQGFALSDGSVVPCCIDYDGLYTFGNVKQKSWNEIWNSKKRRDILTRYFLGDLGVCENCSLGYEYSTTVFERRS